jgi:hypothetical protein
MKNKKTAKKNKFQGFSGITSKQVASTVSKKKKKTSRAGAKKGATSVVKKLMGKK